MSAYLVNDNHINLLVSYFVEYRSNYQLWVKVNGGYGYLTSDNAPDVAYRLHSENVRSVNHRYNETGSDEQYTFNLVADAKQNYSIAEIAGLIDCLECKDLRAYKREDNARQYFNRLKMRYRLTQLKLV